MEFFHKIWEKIRSFFDNKEKTVDQAAIDEARAQRLKEINDPEDDFSNDVAYDAQELEQLSRKAANRRNFRTGYYIFGSFLAVVLVAWGVIGLLTTPQPDICIMIQADGLAENADMESIRMLVADAVGDHNEDGQVVVEVTQISMPAAHTEDNQAAFDMAYEDIEEALISPNIVLIIGREDFLDRAEVVDDLADVRVSLDQTGLTLHENSPLREYQVVARAGESDQAVLAAEVLAKLARQ